jgi:hypothetical protein
MVALDHDLIQSDAVRGKPVDHTIAPIGRDGARATFEHGPHDISLARKPIDGRRHTDQHSRPVRPLALMRAERHIHAVETTANLWTHVINRAPTALELLRARFAEP